MRLTIPFPTSTNKLYRSVSGRSIKSKEYRNWETAAILSLRQQWGQKLPIDKPYAIRMTFTRPDRRRRDIGNLEKATQDALQKAGVISDDALTESVTARWRGLSRGKIDGVIIIRELRGADI